MDLVTKIAKRIVEGVVDSVKGMFTHAIDILALLIICFVVGMLPSWVIGLSALTFIAVIVYFTYKDEINRLEKDED